MTVKLIMMVNITLFYELINGLEFLEMINVVGDQPEKEKDDIIRSFKVIIISKFGLICLSKVYGW
jgi:hypothetical protein